MVLYCLTIRMLHRHLNLSKAWNRKKGREMIMRKCLAIGLLFCALCALAACSDEEVVTQFNEVLQAAGEKVLTSEADLQGTRTFGGGRLCGHLPSPVRRVHREETVFGGTALERDAGNEVTPLLYPDPCGRDGAGAVPEWGQSAGSAFCDTAGSHSATLSFLRRQLYHRAGRKCDRFHPTNGGIKVGIPFRVSLLWGRCCVPYG